MRKKKSDPSVLNRQVLVLNKHWRVIGTTTVKDAIILMCRESALGVCTKSFQTFTWERWLESENPADVEHYVRSASNDVPAPEAVLLTEYEDIYHQSVVFTTNNLYRRDDNTCQYCGKRKHEDDLSIDHVIPRSKGGKTNFDNCVIACLDCNNKKADKLPEEVGMKLLRKPERPAWNPIVHVKPDHRPKSWEHFVKKEWWKS